jgi:hypothetical protein
LLLMSWLKIDDGLFLHPKWVQSPAGARALWITALSYCGKLNTDGCVPAPLLGILGGTAADAEALVEVGLWERTADGYRFHDFAEYNRTSEQQERISEARSEAGRRGGARSAEARGIKQEANGKQTGSKYEANGKQNEAPGSRIPYPVGDISLSRESAHEEPPVETAEPEPVGEAPPVQRKVRDLYIAFRSQRHPTLIPEEFAPAELRRALPALHDMEKAGATTEQVHRATAAAMRRASDPKFVTAQSVVDHWSALLEDDPPPRAPAPASHNGQTGARTGTRRLNYVPPAEESAREIREQLTATANRRLQ